MTQLDETQLNPIQSESKPLKDWVTSFQLLIVAIDPFKHESAWILDTANRILKTFEQANCRVAWLVTGTDKQAKKFLGPLAKERLTFADPKREAVKTMGIETLPALLHINHVPEVIGLAQGWNPSKWREIAKNISEELSWHSPTIPEPNDPAPYAGSPV